MTAAGMSKEIHLVSFGLNYSMIKTYLKVIYIGRKYQKCRRSIDLPSIECTGYEPYEYSWKEKSIGKIHLILFFVIRDPSQSQMREYCYF